MKQIEIDFINRHIAESKQFISDKVAIVYENDLDSGFALQSVLHEAYREIDKMPLDKQAVELLVMSGSISKEMRNKGWID